jgi:hypothetical protein
MQVNSGTQGNSDPLLIGEFELQKLFNSDAEHIIFAFPHLLAPGVKFCADAVLT